MPARTARTRGSASAASGSPLLRAVLLRTGLTTTGLAVLALAVLGFLLGRVLASRPLYLLVYGAVAVVGLAWLSGRSRLSVSATRSTLPARVREGQLVEVEFTVTARHRLSTIVVQEALHSQLGSSVRVPVPALPAGQTVEHSYAFVPRLRGIYQVGPLVAEWRDPFGLVSRRFTIAEAVRLIVHPVTERSSDRVASREWEDPPIRPPLSKPWPTGFEFYGMRDYASGDDPRRIIWRATARTLDPVTGEGRYLVREAEQGITDRVVLLLDTDQEQHSPGVPSDTFERAVSAVASLGDRHLSDGMSVNLETNSSSCCVGLRGRRARIPLLDALAGAQPEPVRLATALQRLYPNPRRSTHHVVVSPHLDSAALRWLRLMADRGTSLLLVVVVTEDTDPAMLHRAGTIGCNVVELTGSGALDLQLRRVVAGGRR
ncbi:MAG: DUF58 domain-containing protein [Mycobacteriales bacterium]